MPTRREEQIKELLRTPELFGIRKLYRYRSMKSRELEGIFARQEIYLPKPTDFNDPFECLPRLTIRMSRLRRELHLKRLAKRGLSSVHRRGQEKWIKEIKIKLTSDPELLAKIPYNEFLNNTGLYCLSELNDDILMWSHYSNGHRGLCLEFDPINDALLDNRMVFGQAICVIYSEERPELNIYNMGEPKEYRNALLTKSIHWEYEKEWRVIKTPNEGGPGIRPFHPSSLTGVIFGALILQEDRQKVMDWIIKYPTKIALYQSKINETKYQVDIEPIN